MGDVGAPPVGIRRHSDAPWLLSSAKHMTISSARFYARITLNKPCQISGDPLSTEAPACQEPTLPCVNRLTKYVNPVTIHSSRAFAAVRALAPEMPPDAACTRGGRYPPSFGSVCAHGTRPVAVSRAGAGPQRRGPVGPPRRGVTALSPMFSSGRGWPVRWLRSRENPRPIGRGSFIAYRSRKS